MGALPGNPAVVKQGADRLVSSAHSIADAISDLRALVFSSESVAIEKIRLRTSKVTSKIDKTHVRYLDTGRALQDYHHQMLQAHNDANRAAEDKRLAEANHAQTSRTEHVCRQQYNRSLNNEIPEFQRQNLWRMYQDARWKRKNSENAISAANQRIEDARRRMNEAAEAAIRRIDSALQGTNDSFLDKVSNFVGKLRDTLVSIAEWVNRFLKTVIERMQKLLELIATVVCLVVLVVVAVSITLGLGIVLLLGALTVISVGLLVVAISIAASHLFLALGAAIAVGLALGVVLAIYGKETGHYLQRVAEAKNKALIEQQKKYGNGDDKIFAFDSKKNDKESGVLKNPGEKRSKYAEVRDMAKLADAAYYRDASAEELSKQLPEGYRAVSEAELHELGLTWSDFGGDGDFAAILFVDSEGNYVLSYQGSQDLEDWLNNGYGGLLHECTDQDRAAIHLATKVKSALERQGHSTDNMMITGHSLGGRHAQAASIATGLKAYTFNAAGISNDAIDYAKQTAAANGVPDRGLTYDAQNIMNVQYAKCPLMGAQDHFPFLAAQPFGLQWDLTGPEEEVSPDAAWEPLLTNHGVPKIIEAIDRKIVEEQKAAAGIEE